MTLSKHDRFFAAALMLGFAASNLAGCAASAESESEFESIDTADGLDSNGASTLRFSDRWAVSQRGALVRGQRVKISYDIGRAQCQLETNGVRMWNLRMHYRMNGGSNQYLDMQLPNRVPAANATQATVEFSPPESGALELWFESKAPDVPCQAWDSNLGANYRFAVANLNAASGHSYVRDLAARDSVSGTLSATDPRHAYGISLAAGENFFATMQAPTGSSGSVLGNTLKLYRANNVFEAQGDALAISSSSNHGAVSSLGYFSETAANYVLVASREGDLGQGRYTVGTEKRGRRVCVGNGECGNGAYCAREESLCGSLSGLCKATPSQCEESEANVCGCNDQTYRNACDAALHGVSVQRQGACEEPDPMRVCGTRGAEPCAENEYCRFGESAMCGASDRGGVCTLKPTECGWNLSTVCGCDNVEYTNACLAAKAGVSVAFADYCSRRPR